MQGKVAILSAPSGSGKTTILKYLLKEDLNLEFSVSACNRNKRKGEVHGRDYYFLSTPEFMRKIKENAFIEWEEVYAGRYYGTLRSEIERIWNKGNNVIFEVDVKGGLKLKNVFGDQAVSIFIQPPSIEELRNRLFNRSSESPEEIESRIQKANEEMMYANEFDHVIVNNNLDEAKKETYRVIKRFCNKN